MNREGVPMVCEMIGGPQDGHTLRIPGDKPVPQVRLPAPETASGQRFLAEYVFDRATDVKWFYTYRCLIEIPVA